MTTTLRASALPLALLGAAALASACDLIEGVTATKIVSGIVIATPELKLTGSFDVKSETIATAWIGQRDSPTSTAEPSPLTGVDVKLTTPGGTFALTEETSTPGVYLVTSTSQSGLTYQAGASYGLDALIQGASYGNDGTAPPRLDAGSLTFTPTLGAGQLQGVRVHARNTALTVQWPSTAGRYAYVSVLRAKPSAPTEPELVFDNRPETAGEILSFVLGDPKSSIEIPGGTIATTGLYAVVVVAMNKGTPRSGTFSGSPMLVGSGAATLLSIE
jgi:hypothetical protein